MRSPITRGLALLLGLALLAVLAFRQQPLVVIQQLSIGGSAADAAVSVATALPALNATAAPPLPTRLTLQTAMLFLTIDHVDPVAGGVKSSGSVKNTSPEELSVPIGAFELYDNAGASFIAGGGAAAALKSGESTPLELTSPVFQGRTLAKLVLRLLPDAPVELALPPSAPLPGEPLPTVAPTTAPYEQAMRPWSRA